jgi:acetamidase/formamidase
LLQSISGRRSCQAQSAWLGKFSRGKWAGNLDIPDVCPGHRILLPIFHAGARFHLGDVHASQGDTEVTGTRLSAVQRLLRW